MSGAVGTGGAARIGGNILALLGARVVSVVFSFVQASVIVSSLGPVGMGHFSYAWGLTSLLTIFATLGVRRVLIRDIARRPEETWTLVWTATAMVVVLSAMVLLLVFLAEYGLDGNAPRRAAVMVAVLWIVVLWAWQQPFEAILMARERMILAGVLQVIVAVLKVASVYWFLSVGSTGADAHGALLLANVLGLGLFVLAAIRIEGWAPPRFDLAALWRLIAECRPMLAAAILAVVYFKSDIVLLSWLRGDEATGIYGAVQRISEPLSMMAGVLGTALFPALCRYSAGASDNFALLRRTSARLVLIVSMPMAFGLAAVADPVIGLLARDRAAEFALSVTVLQIACGVIPFFYFNGIAMEFLYANDENWFVVRTYACAAAVSVVGNLIAVSLWGVLAVPCVAIVVNAMISVMYYVKLRNALREARLLTLTLKTTIACGLMGGLAWWIAGHSLIAALASGALVYPLLQLAMGALSPLERQLMRRVTQTVTRRLGMP